MMADLLFWITGFLPCRIINDGERPYLERYYLFTLLGWRFYLHQFVDSDPSRGLHDHPWRKAYSFILTGWYWEQTRSGTRKVFWFNSLTGDTFHRVVLPFDRTEAQIPTTLYEIAPLIGVIPRPCWTLFFHRAENVKPWGFMREIPKSDGVTVFEPYRYTREGSQKDWWLTAPKGSFVRAQRAAR